MIDTYVSPIYPRDVSQVLRILAPRHPLCPQGGAVRMEHVECSIEPFQVTRLNRVNRVIDNLSELDEETT